MLGPILAWVAIGFATPARAQTAETIAAAAKAADNISNTGLLGSIAILAVIAAGAVITVLWLKGGSKDKEIRGLNKDLVTAVGKAEHVSGDITNALKSLETANRASAEQNADRWDAVKGMSVDLVKVGIGVASNADTISQLRAEIVGLRGEIQGLWRRSQS